MVNYNKLLRDKLKPEVEEEEVLLTPEEQFVAGRGRMVEILKSLIASGGPPGFAKALCRNHVKVQEWARAVLGRKDDDDLVRRFAEHADLLAEFRKEMAAAHKEASNSRKFPIVCTPTNIFAEILGQDFEQPEDSSHWPENRRDGPITWEG